jgi:hypothetical protein
MKNIRATLAGLAAPRRQQATPSARPPLYAEPTTPQPQPQATEPSRSTPDSAATSSTALESSKLVSLLCPSCKHGSLYNIRQPRFSHTLTCPHCHIPFTSRLVLIRSADSTPARHYREYSVRAIDELGVEHLFEFIDRKKRNRVELNPGDLVSFAYIGVWPISVENFSLARFWVLGDTPRTVRLRWAAIIISCLLIIGVLGGAFVRSGKLALAGSALESLLHRIPGLNHAFAAGNSTPGIALTPPAGAHLGTPTQLDGYSLIVTDIQEGVDLGGFHSAADGNKLIALQINFTNESNAKGLAITPLAFTLVDAIGNKYPVQVGGCKELLTAKDLAPAEALTGCVAFEVPLATVATGVQYPIAANPRIELQASAVK